MAIISRNKLPSHIHTKNAQVRYAILYTAITLAAMFLLNFFCSKISLRMFYSSKEVTMLDKSKMASIAIGSLEVINNNTVTEVIDGFDTTNLTRIVVTDQNGLMVYDSAGIPTDDSGYALFPEIITALDGNDVFYCSYKNGSLRSMAAAPIYSYGAAAGCVYIMELDATQSTIISALQSTILTITVVLEIIVIISSFASADTYSRRLRKLMSAIRIVKNGDYSHRLQVHGHDELTTLSSEFNDLILRLQVSENKRSQFVSDASHELKTPLASIKLLSDSILQNNMDQDTVKEFVSDIGNEAERLNRMSQKLLTLSRSDTQDAESDCDIVYICPTIERVVRMLSANLDEKKIKIIQDIREDVSILIPEDHLYQIIFNLIENGIKYNTENGQLKLSLSRLEDNAVLSISDTGMGIPEESLTHIFERFYRVDKARSRSTGGSGLGLSIVRSLVEKNNGEITVDSTVGKGTTFTLVFPAFDVEEENE